MRPKKKSSFLSHFARNALEFECNENSYFCHDFLSTQFQNKTCQKIVEWQNLCTMNVHFYCDQHANQFWIWAPLPYLSFYLNFTAIFLPIYIHKNKWFGWFFSRFVFRFYHFNLVLNFINITVIISKWSFPLHKQHCCFVGTMIQLKCKKSLYISSIVLIA